MKKTEKVGLVKFSPLWLGTITTLVNDLEKENRALKLLYSYGEDRDYVSSARFTKGDEEVWISLSKLEAIELTSKRIGLLQDRLKELVG